MTVPTVRIAVAAVLPSGSVVEGGDDPQTLYAATGMVSLAAAFPERVVEEVALGRPPVQSAWWERLWRQLTDGGMELSPSRPIGQKTTGGNKRWDRCEGIRGFFGPSPVGDQRKR